MYVHTVRHGTKSENNMIIMLVSRSTTTFPVQLNSQLTNQGHVRYTGFKSDRRTRAEKEQSKSGAREKRAAIADGTCCGGPSLSPRHRISSTKPTTVTTLRLQVTLFQSVLVSSCPAQRLAGTRVLDTCTVVPTRTVSSLLAPCTVLYSYYTALYRTVPYRTCEFSIRPLPTGVSPGTVNAKRQAGGSGLES